MPAGPRERDAIIPVSSSDTVTSDSIVGRLALDHGLESAARSGLMEKQLCQVELHDT